MPQQLLPAIKLLVLGGVGNLVLSFLLGWLLSAKRMKEPMDKHRWLLIAHEVSLQEGLMLLGLGFSLQFAKLSPSLAVIGAWLLIAGSLFQDFSGILNWLRAVDDQFKAKSLGWVSATINAILNTAGLGIIAYGVFAGM
jgi:hypothetical protein